jgi:hypothetical protein
MIVVNTSHGEEKSLFCPEERGSNFFYRKVKKNRCQNLQLYNPDDNAFEYSQSYVP